MYWHQVQFLDTDSHNVNISRKKGLTGRQAGDVYSKCNNEEIIATEHVCECESKNEEKN